MLRKTTSRGLCELVCPSRARTGHHRVLADGYPTSMFGDGGEESVDEAELRRATGHGEP